LTGTLKHLQTLTRVPDISFIADRLAVIARNSLANYWADGQRRFRPRQRIAKPARAQHNSCGMGL